MEKFYDERGMVWGMLEAPEGTTGLILGPPDFSSLRLPIVQERKLRELLVANELFSAPMLMGQRPKLFEILAEVGLPREFIRTLVSHYQIDYDGDGENG